MNRNRVWSDWKLVGLALAACVGAFLIRAGAWRAGYAADALGLAGFHLLKFPVLLAGWCALAALIKEAARADRPAGAGGFTVLDALGLSFFVVTACGGCNSL